MRLYLNDYLPLITQRHEWYSPVGAFITLTTPLTTASFQKDTFAIPKEAWHGLFLIATVIFGVLSLYTVIRALRAPSMDRIKDDIIKSMKNQ